MGGQAAIGVFTTQGRAGPATRRGEALGRGVHEGAEGTGDQGTQAVLGAPSGGDDQRGKWTDDKRGRKSDV